MLGTRAGAYTATLLLARTLPKHGIAVTCFSTWTEPGYPAKDDEFKAIKPLIERGYRWDLPNRCLAFQAIRHIKRSKPAFVFVIGVTRLSRYLLASSISHHLLVWELTEGRANKFVDVEASRMLRRCRAMLSPSMTVDQNIRKHYGYEGPILRLPFWIEDQNRPFNPRSGEFLADFIYLGRRDEEKGLRELVQAMALLVAEYPEVKVVIGGLGDERPFASLAVELSVEKNISFDYFQSSDEVMQALSRSRCLVLPSYHEGYPLVLLEAAQASVPFVATNVGSILEAFGESSACIIIEPRDSKSLAQAMKQMLQENADTYSTRRKAAFDVFQRLSSSDRVTENLNAVLAQLEPSANESLE